MTPPEIVVHDTASGMRRLFGLPLEERPAALRELYGLAMDATGMAAMALRAHEPGGDAFQIAADDPRYATALERLVEADAWGLVERGLRDAWAYQASIQPETRIADRIDVRLVLGNPDDRLFVDRTLGYYGMGSMPGSIWLVAWPTEYNRTRIGACAVHEFGHQIRFMNVPFRPRVADWLLSEGLAETFAVEVCGADSTGGWYAGVTDDELERSTAIVMDGLDLEGFGVASAYVLGDETARKNGHPTVGLAHMAGYAVGRRLIDRYLAETGLPIAAAQLRPADEILAVVRG